MRSTQTFRSTHYASTCVCTSGMVQNQAMLWITVIVSLILQLPPETLSNSIRWLGKNYEFKDGKLQSPVDINRKIAEEEKFLDNLKINMVLSPGDKSKVYNAGHTVKITIEKDQNERPYMTGGPLEKEKFFFDHLHFHWGNDDNDGSEHTIDGKRYALEIHIVHLNSKYATCDQASKEKDGFAVLTIFAKVEDKDNKALKSVTDLFGGILKPKQTKVLDSSKALGWVTSAISGNHEYYSYPGSLTTDPFSEDVIFILLPEPITISHDQLVAFRKLHDDHEKCILKNKRDPQAWNDRQLIHSNKLEFAQNEGTPSK